MPRRFCCDEDLALIGYDGQEAAQNLADWQRNGPRPTTQELIEVITAHGVEDAAVLDVGAGVGALHTALLEAGAASAVDVDASREYLATARKEADRRGLADRIDYRYGDLVELAPELPPAEIVTLDAVICCYPYLAPLLEAVVSVHPRLVGLTYPRDVWWMIAFMRLYNITMALRRSPARYFVHRRSEVDRLMADVGFVNAYDGGIRPWRVVVYKRDAGPAPQ